MKKKTIVVPKGIRYISEWDKLEEGQRLRDQLPKDTPYIMNKTITGCGYTEYCITNPSATIICSPRLVLLENKEDQHRDMENLLYLRNEYDTFGSFDKDISKDDDKGLHIEQKEKTEEEIKRAEEYTNYLKIKLETISHIVISNYTKIRSS